MSSAGTAVVFISSMTARLVGEDAVGPTFDGEGDARHLPFAGEEDFGGVAFACGLLELAVDACALVGAVEAGKAAVDAAGAEQKFHQLADRQAKSRHSGSLPFF